MKRARACLLRMFEPDMEVNSMKIAVIGTGSVVLRTYEPLIEAVTELAKLEGRDFNVVMDEQIAATAPEPDSGSGGTKV